MKTIKYRHFKILILILSLNILILSEIYYYNLHSNNDSELSIDFSISNNITENQMVLELSNIPSDLLYSIPKSNLKWQLSGIGGVPQLPVRHYKILLPPNTDPESVKMNIIKSTSVDLEGEYYFPPGPNIMTSMSNKNLLAFSEDSSNIYNKNSYWPSEYIDSFNVQQMRDAVIADFYYYPYQYNPIDKAVVEHRDVKISINWDKIQNKNMDLLTGKFLSNLGEDIDNLADILPMYEIKPTSTSYIYPMASDIPDSTYLIITTNAIESNSDKLDDFIRYKQALGFSVVVITEDEYGSATGQQRVFNIRSWLQNHYVSDSIEYVLLIGNPDPDDPTDGSDSIGDLPMLMCYPEGSWNPGWPYNTPTDYIYADLTGNWDSDGDGYYGEWGYQESSPNDAGVDFVPEVYVGRIPVYSSDYATLDNILQEIINHHINAGDEKYKILEPMAISNYANEDGGGSARTDGLNCPADVYNNILSGIGMDDTVMYERSGLDPVPTSAFHYDMPLTSTNVISEFNNGHGAVFWWGHGDYYGVYRKYWASDDGDNIPEGDEMSWPSFLTSGDMSSLENDQPAFFYQSSCLNGEPEYSDNLQYSLLKRGAGVNTVSATRVSWYVVGTWNYDTYWPTFTDNTGIGYYYMDNLLKAGMTAGPALYSAKEDGGVSGGVYGGGYHAWMNKMDFNIYGDPQIDYWGSNQPNAPSNPSPADGATGIDTNPTLSVGVSDPDGGTINVAFYDASDNSLIGIDLDVLDGQVASVPWAGLSTDTTYSWYVIVGDGQVIRQSSTWSFTTGNTAPNAPINPTPSDGATSVSINPTLSVDVSDPDGDIMDVSFYDASDDSLIGIATGVPSGSKASVLWSDLSEGTTYSWYAVASDGSASTTSSTWSFTAFLDNPTWDQPPTNQIIEYGNSLNYDLNASDLSGIALYWVNDTINFNIDGNGVLTNKTRLTPGIYWLELKAYDPFDNFCSGIIKIIVKEPEEPPKPTPPKIPGFNVILLICTISIVSLAIIKMKKKN
ncbi:MAG: C25 family cysteine peptidase [Promethearchaeota archaeon]